MYSRQAGELEIMNTTHMPHTHSEQVYAVVDAARPHNIVPCAAHMLFLVPPDEVDSVIARVPALVDWIDTAASTGQRRELGGRPWVAVRFYPAPRPPLEVQGWMQRAHS